MGGTAMTQSPLGTSCSVLYVNVSITLWETHVQLPKSETELKQKSQQEIVMATFSSPWSGKAAARDGLPIGFYKLPC